MIVCHQHIPPLLQHGIYITLPEDTLTLTCPSSGDKNLWMNALQEGIKRTVEKSEDSSGTTVTIPRSPPLVRNASYTFSKNPLYKDATYSGAVLEQDNLLPVFVLQSFTTYLGFLYHGYLLVTFLFKTTYF